MITISLCLIFFTAFQICGADFVATVKLLQFEIQPDTTHGNVKCQTNSTCNSFISMCMNGERQTCEKVYVNTTRQTYAKKATDLVEVPNLSLAFTGSVPESLFIFFNVSFASQLNNSDNDNRSSVIPELKATVDTAKCVAQWLELSNFKRNATLKLKIAVRIDCINKFYGNSCSSIDIQSTTTKSSPQDKTDPFGYEVTVPWWLLTSVVGSVLGGLLVAAIICFCLLLTKRIATAHQQPPLVQRQPSENCPQNTYTARVISRLVEMELQQRNQESEYDKLDVRTSGDYSDVCLDLPTDEQLPQNEAELAYKLPRSNSLRGPQAETPSESSVDIEKSA